MKNSDKPNAVKVSNDTDVLLKQITKLRDSKVAHTVTKIMVIDDLIKKAHKRECK